MIKAIETSYKGYRFRSRLEARWAVFFDALELPWDYEPEGFEFGDGLRYLPDFRVRYPGRCDAEAHDVWFEVKPNLAAITPQEWLTMREWEKHSECRLFILDGVPDRVMYLAVADICSEYFDSDPCAPLRRNIKDVIPPTPAMIKCESSRDRCGFGLWSTKGRLWYDSPCAYYEDGYGSDPEVQRAIDAARSARFEHGESGARR